jgi:D-3-phosphoglycerate dehydrogenase
MERILVLNEVSQNGLNVFGDQKVGQDVINPTAIIVRSAKVNTDQYPDLVAVARAGTGVDNISIAKATEKGVCVFNAPGANANAVAELVFIMLGLHARRVDKALQFIHDLDWNDADTATKVEAGKSKFTGFELTGKTLGVIGLGKIGVLVSNAGIERGMRVIGYDAFPTLAGMHRLNPKVEIVRHMEEIFASADIISVHVPLTEKTRNLIGTDQIALMKPDCIVMNYSRDGIYDDEAVIEALTARKIAAFITDFPTKTLCQNPHVICTPHLGASTAESEENCSLMAARELKNYLEYGVVNNSVNFPEIEMFLSQTIRTRLAIASKDMPNMIAAITGVLGDAGVNIQSLANGSNGTISYNLVDLEVDVDDQLIKRIRHLPGVLRVRALKFSK